MDKEEILKRERIIKKVKSGELTVQKGMTLEQFVDYKLAPQWARDFVKSIDNFADSFLHYGEVVYHSELRKVKENQLREKYGLFNPTLFGKGTEPLIRKDDWSNGYASRIMKVKKEEILYQIAELVKDTEEIDSSEKQFLISAMEKALEETMKALEGKGIEALFVTLKEFIKAWRGKLTSIQSLTETGDKRQTALASGEPAKLYTADEDEETENRKDTR